MFPQDKCLITRSEKVHKGALRDYDAGDYHGCCSRIAEALEMLGTVYLIHHNGFENGLDVYNKYGHSVKGRFKDLENVLYDNEVSAAIFSIYPLNNPKNSHKNSKEPNTTKERELDKGLNGYRYAHYNKYRDQPCPDDWVHREMADKIINRTSDVIDELIRRAKSGKF